MAGSVQPTSLLPPFPSLDGERDRLLGRWARSNSVFLGLGEIPSSTGGMIPQEELCFPGLPISDLEKRLYTISGLGADRMVAGRDHMGAESEMGPVCNPL